MKYLNKDMIIRVYGELFQEFKITLIKKYVQLRNKKARLTCPRCEEEALVKVPGVFRCSQCLAKFNVDAELRMTIDGKHQPNKIAAKYRNFYLAISPIMLVYGMAGLTANDIYIPGKRSSGIHFHNYAAVLVFVVFVFLILNMVSTILDHYDRRDNEINYRRFSRLSLIIAAVLFGLALVLQGQGF